MLAWLSVWSKVQTCIWPSWCHCHSQSLASLKSRIGFTFLAPAHLGSPWQRAIKRMCACVFQLNFQFVPISHIVKLCSFVTQFVKYLHRGRCRDKTGRSLAGHGISRGSRRHGVTGFASAAMWPAPRSSWLAEAPRWCALAGWSLGGRRCTSGRHDDPTCLHRHHLDTHPNMRFSWQLKGKGSPYSITEHRVPELIPVLGSQPHKPGDRLPLLSVRPAVTFPVNSLVQISLLGEQRHDGCA